MSSLYSHFKLFISMCICSTVERNTVRTKSIRQFKYKVYKPSAVKKVITGLPADDGATCQGML